MTFAERLKQLRTERKMSMDDVARQIGVGRANIYKYEHGIVTNIPPERISQLANLFGVSRPYLMGWIDEDDSSAETILLPDNDTFLKAYTVMDEEDRKTLIRIFAKAQEKLREEEWKKQNKK